MAARSGVRSTEEVLLHVAGDNYFMPALMGVPAPADTGIDGVRSRSGSTAGVRGAYAATILTGVPTRTSLRSATMSLFRRRTQPCETA